MRGYPIRNDNGTLTLNGAALRMGDRLELRWGREWKRVILGESHDRYRRPVLRFEEQPTVSVLAAGSWVRK